MITQSAVIPSRKQWFIQIEPLTCVWPKALLRLISSWKNSKYWWTCGRWVIRLLRQQFLSLTASLEARKSKQMYVELMMKYKRKRQSYIHSENGMWVSVLNYDFRTHLYWRVSRDSCLGNQNKGNMKINVSETVFDTDFSTYVALAVQFLPIYLYYVQICQENRQTSDKLTRL